MSPGKPTWLGVRERGFTESARRAVDLSNLPTGEESLEELKEGDSGRRGEIRSSPNSGTGRRLEFGVPFVAGDGDAIRARPAAASLSAGRDILRLPMSPSLSASSAARSCLLFRRRPRGSSSLLRVGAPSDASLRAANSLRPESAPLFKLEGPLSGGVGSRLALTAAIGVESEVICGKLCNDAGPQRRLAMTSQLLPPDTIPRT